MRPTDRYARRAAAIARLPCVVAILTGLWLSSTGCAGGSAPGLLERDPERFTLTSDQLQVVVVGYASEFATAVAATADRVADAAGDPEVTRQTLVWKTAVVPQVYVVASAPDPALALVDLWTLAEQQEALLESGAGSRALGSGQRIAVDAADRLSQRARLLVARTLTSQEAVERLAGLVTTFVAQHPIRDFRFARESIVPEYAQLLTAPDGLLGQVEAVGDAAEMAVNLALAALRHGPELARWQAELALMDVSRSSLVGEMARSAQQLSGSAFALGELAGRFPETIAHERIAAFDELRRLQDVTVSDLDAMRTDTMEALSGERQIVLDSLDAEREIVLSSLHAELGRLIAAASSERAAFAHDLAQVIARTEQGFAHDARDLVDHIFYRTIQLLVGLAVIALLALGIWRLARTRRARSARAA